MEELDMGIMIDLTEAELNAVSGGCGGSAGFDFNINLAGSGEGAFTTLSVIARAMPTGSSIVASGSSSVPPPDPTLMVTPLA